MSSKNKYTGIDPIITSIVRSKAKELINYKPFKDYDLDDIEQELMIDLVIKLENFSSTYSLYAFVKKIIYNKSVSMMRSKSTQKRGFELVNSEIDCQMDYTFLDDYSDIESLEIKIDLKKIVSNLPADLIELHELMEIMSLNEIVKFTGKSRKTIYRKLQKLKKYLVDFSDFLKKR